MKLTRAFVDDIREPIVSARASVARDVDLVQVHTNFEIARRIVQQEQRGQNRATYGKEVIEILAARLSVEFGTGFSKSNLEYMRRFSLIHHDRARIAQTTSGQSKAKNRAVASADAIQSASFRLSWFPLRVPARHQGRRGAQLLRDRSCSAELDPSRAQAPVRCQPLRAAGAQPRQEGRSTVGPRWPSRERTA